MSGMFRITSLVVYYEKVHCLLKVEITNQFCGHACKASKAVCLYLWHYLGPRFLLRDEDLGFANLWPHLWNTVLATHASSWWCDDFDTWTMQPCQLFSITKSLRSVQYSTSQCREGRSDWGMNVAFWITEHKIVLKGDNTRHEMYQTRWHCCYIKMQHNLAFCAHVCFFVDFIKPSAGIENRCWS